MALILFTYSDVNGLHQEASFGHEDFEACLDVLSQLVDQGFLLKQAYLIQGSQQIELPIEVFDGSPMGYAIRSLQEQWEMVLC